MGFELFIPEWVDVELVQESWSEGMSQRVSLSPTPTLYLFSLLHSHVISYSFHLGREVASIISDKVWLGCFIVFLPFCLLLPDPRWAYLEWIHSYGTVSVCSNRSDDSGDGVDVDLLEIALTASADDLLSPTISFFPHVLDSNTPPLLLELCHFVWRRMEYNGLQLPNFPLS